MSVLEIERELRKMSNAERLIVIELATKLLRDALPPGKLSLSVSEKRRKLKASAEIMRAEYVSDKDLVALTTLDSEEFLEAYLWRKKGLSVA